MFWIHVTKCYLICHVSDISKQKRFHAIGNLLSQDKNRLNIYNEKFRKKFFAIVF